MFGLEVRSRRQSLGYSQEAFADVLGMHRTQLGHIEQGRKDCRLSTVKRLADALGVSVQVLTERL
ncbi:helix-turn-helix transcriptional regulator [Xanthomonas euroxanthea]|nr:helix-turn-helix transcriptional regulator [Xanthomonas euroxanthea]